MQLALLMAFQAAAAPAPSAAAPIDFDLAKARPTDMGLGRSRPCAEKDPDEIVVCGRRPGGDAYPLDEMSRRFESRPMVAETGIGGGATARAYADSVQMPNSEISKRIMVGIKLPF